MKSCSQCNVTVHVSEDVFDQISAVGDEFIWFPKVESSPGRSMIIDLETARDIRGDFDLPKFYSIMKTNTELQVKQLQEASYIYFVDIE
ncbi:hypothetical protein ACP179_01795 (plasmid) [Xenorhabdus stockiae]|uniref:hypothetical protein n=1 Tax=Xenorhabdus stockiae TaxID=351614 RepID=UPI003CF9A16E